MPEGGERALPGLRELPGSDRQKASGPWCFGDAIDERLHYYRPKCAPDVLEIDRNAFSHLLSHKYAVAVIDGANISMALCGLNPNDADDVARWHAKIMLPIARRPGAATFANDHVPKNNSSYSGFAIGSQHKVAGLTGAAFVMEKMVTFGRGRHGVATVRVGDKDREGYVHGSGRRRATGRNAGRRVARRRRGVTKRW